MNNKKTSVLTILTACMLLAACGKTEQQTTAEIDTNEVAAVTAEVVEDTKSAEPTKETTEGYKTKAEKIAKNDLVDVAVGNDVITVNDVKTPHREFHLADVPTVHILVPSDDIICTTEEGDSMHFRQYRIAVPDSENAIYCRVNLNGPDDCYCAVRHEEAIEYGRYMLDYNWCQIAIYDAQTDTAIVVMFGAADEHTDETSDYVASLTDANIEYIKQQVSAWNQDFIPNVEENVIDDADVSGASDNDGLLECDIIPCGFYDLDGNKYVMISTYDDDDSGECMLMFGRYDGADSPFDYYDLENVDGGNTYSATNWDKVSVTVTFSDGGMDLSEGTEELEEYNGHYTLQ